MYTYDDDDNKKKYLEVGRLVNFFLLKVKVNPY